ncbi:DUF4349 domain-containing protein [Chondromyces crocatus]|uniref:DUF4349 domain-containing protein n=1 Tax=Chondromyces crocatus TaxID=52 RepID=A0A0K1EAY0_CHOCO|nr:DUF4349 domain-containing protein [Chondromyces crocatus]AKT38009.1 uncharacterized protein CMC5_021500 [Chondromyces crocatus]
MQNLVFPWAMFMGVAALGCGGGGYDATSRPPMLVRGPSLVAESAPAMADGLEEVGAVPAMDDERAETWSASRALAKEAPPPPAGSAAGSSGGGGAATGAKVSQAVEARAPLLVYTARMLMAAFDMAASLNRVEAMAVELGGFMSKRTDLEITVRVPAAAFDTAVRRLEAMGDVLKRDVKVEDVTEEFLDLEVRLRNARAVRDRVEKLLDKASNVEESLLLEKELGRVSGDIERLEGRLKVMRDKASFSTITVLFQSRPKETIDPGGARLPIPWLHALGLSRLLNL